MGQTYSNLSKRSSESFDAFEYSLPSRSPTQHSHNSDSFIQHKELQYIVSAEKLITEAVAPKMNNLNMPSTTNRAIANAERQLPNQPTAPTTNSPQPPASSRYRSYRPSPYGSTTGPTRTSRPNAALPVFQPYPLQSGRHSSAAHSATGHAPSPSLGNSPSVASSVSSQDFLLDLFSPLQSTPTPSPSLLPVSSATPRLQVVANTHIPNSDDASSFDTIPIPTNNPPMHMGTYSTKCRVPPLTLVSELFLPERQLSAELAASRDNMKWVEWEHQLIVFGLLGPQTAPSLIVLLFHTFEEIENFAVSHGLDLNLPEFDDIPALVNQIITMWRQYIPEGEGWGKLKFTDVATWTYDTRNGWLAMVYRRLKEVKIRSPLKAWRQSHASMRVPALHRSKQPQTEAPIATPDPKAGLPVVPPSQDTPTHESPRRVDELDWESQPDPVTQSLTTPNGPFVEPYSVSANYLAADREVLGVSLEATPSPDPYLSFVTDHRPPSPVAHDTDFDHFLRLVQSERTKRYLVAREIIRTCEPKSEARISAEAWIAWEFFNTHSTDDVARWMAEFELRLPHEAGALNSAQALTAITTSITPLSLPGLDDPPNPT
ncbi:unnamed protein product [Rhizoctonia solani]|nr:unnamed protein product [Rhizoctonia solani]